jgi:transposase
VAQIHPISRLGCWEGYEVSQQRSERRAGRSWCVIRLEPIRGYRRCCSRCGQMTSLIHDFEERRIRDLPLFEHRVELLVPRVRVECPSCGPRLERLGWLDAYARVTRRLAESVARLCKVMTLRHVAGYFELDWKTVKAIDRAALQRELGPLDLDGLEVIALDEFAIHKGHRYATVIVEPTRKRVLWVGRGRGRDDVRPFFERLGPERCRRLQAAVMDMNASYELEVRTHCPNAVIVFDLFRAGRQVVKSARWLLLKNRDSLRPGEDVQLEELLAANHELFVVYVLRDTLKALWAHRDPRQALRAWYHWYHQAQRSAIPALVRFARHLRPYLPGILAHCHWPLGTNLVEGINNKIKVLKRMAYGFRDEAYFFLKIRAAFPGVGR